jgi:hypothetical protein
MSINRNTINQNYSFLADGIRMKTDLVDFLKGVGRELQRYNV